MTRYNEKEMRQRVSTIGTLYSQDFKNVIAGVKAIETNLEGTVHVLKIVDHCSSACILQKHRNKCFISAIAVEQR